MVKAKYYIDSFGIIRYHVIEPKLYFFSYFFNGNTRSSTISSFIEDFEEIKLKKIDDIKEEIMDWHPNLYTHPKLGLHIPVWGIDMIDVYYTEAGKLMIKPNNDDPALNTSFDEIIDFLKKVRDIYLRYEQAETFSIFPNLLALVNKKYAKKLETFGFRVVGQTADMVRFVKDWLIIDLLEDKDGAVLFFTDQRNGQRYEFNMALELLDWDAGNMHALLCQKYQRKMSKDEARTGIMEVTFQYLESHFKGILESLDETFFEKLETERQLRTEMLKKVLSLPKDNLIHQMFVNDNPVWWEYMREGMKN